MTPEPSRAKTWGIRVGRILIGFLLASLLCHLCTAYFHWRNPRHSAWDPGMATAGVLWILAASTAHTLRRHAVAVDLWIVFLFQWVIPGALLWLILSAGH